ncbi:prefoldin subunit alpha [Candidatus Woesearchaeota archaeon CG08_land_8_20_14_0_20_43_7]|nr:MAG: prefoldin subunit alpha [Candidatus Woesearchaeota archaeon CG08_land_8_20_14_0_20_43_7]
MTKDKKHCKGDHENCDCTPDTCSCSGHNDAKKDLQTRYAELQMIGQQLQQLQKQMQAVDSQLNELTFNIQSLTEFKNLKVGSEILVPVSNGIFAKAELKDTEKLLTNIGADTVVQKTVDETIDMLKIQIIEIERYKVQLTNVIGQLQEQGTMLQKEIQHMAV